MDQEYLINRDKSFINKYKLKRRAENISEALRILGEDKALSLLDVGSADGYLLSFLHKSLNVDKSVVIEPSFDCVKRRVSTDLDLIVAVAESMPFRDDSFDAIIAASVIDHLQDVGRFFRESRRILRRKGLLAVTAIIPFYDRLANRFGVDNGLHPHVKTYSMGEIEEALRQHDFRVILAKRFALPSFGLMPFERQLELALGKMHLNHLMFYSLVVGRKE